MHDPRRARGITPELRPSYSACRRFHRRHDPTFYFATRRLPPEVRPAVHALYAFVRSADELVDGAARPAEPAARRAALDGLEATLRDGLAGRDTPSFAVTALADAGRRHRLPLGELDTYIRSMRIDCGPVRLSSASELSEYMEGSAAAVGRIMAPLLGAPADGAEPFARLGRAFQLTNFVRDVREDFALDRIYLPGVEEEALSERRATAAFRRAVAWHVARARELFRDGAPALTAVHARMRPGMRMAQAVYLAVLDRVEALDYDVLGRKAAVSPWEATGAALAAFWSRA